MVSLDVVEKGFLWTYGFGHTNTRISYSEGLIFLVGDDVNAEVLAGVELAWV